MDDIDLLARKLESADVEERREATIGLSQAGSAAVVPLFRALADNDWRVRKTAVEAIVSVGGESSVAGLIEALSAQDNAGMRNSAIEALIQIGSPTLDALLPMIETPDPDVRKFIVDILGEIKDRRAVPALIKGLEDVDDNIRVAAAEALGKIRDPQAVDALLACLSRSDQSWLDYAAAEALGEIGDERALKPLLEALNRVSLREPIIASIGKIGNVHTLEPLLAGLADSLRVVREVSIEALAAIARKSSAAEQQTLLLTVRGGMTNAVVGLLEEILTSSAGDLQKATIALLGWVGRESSIRKILSLLTEEDLEEPIVMSLQHINSTQAAVLADYLSSDNALIRRAVARVWGDIGSSAAEQPLLGLLNDENGHVRSTAAIALGRLRSKAAIKPLLTMLSDEYESVQEAAILALATIGDDSMLDELIRDFSTRDALLRRNISLLLGKFSTNKALAALAFALKDEEPDVRKAVVLALGSVPSGKSLKSLLLAITDDDPEVRMIAAEALASLNAPETFAALVPLLEDSDLWVRAAAARGLGRVGGERAGKVLTAHLGTATDVFLLALVEALGTSPVEAAQQQLAALTDHPDPEVRKTVLLTLRGYSGEGVQKAVRARLSDPHWSVRKAAIEVLRQKHDSAAVESLLETIARSDPDMTVRQAAKEALGS